MYALFHFKFFTRSRRNQFKRGAGQPGQSRGQVNQETAMKTNSQQNSTAATVIAAESLKLSHSTATVIASLVLRGLR